MVSQTWDGKRVYFTSSLLANWDKKGKDDEQFLKAYTLGREEADAALRASTSRRRSSAARTIMHFGQDAVLQEPDLLGAPTRATRARRAP